MIEQLQSFFKDPAKVTRLTIAGFFVMVLLAAYYLSTLPNDLVYKGGLIDSGRAAGVYTKLFIVIGLAFAFCYASIYYLQATKKETIVYLDKKTESSFNQQGSGTGTGFETSTLDARMIQEKISKSGTLEEKLQQGLNQFCDQLNAGQGALYLIAGKGEKKSLKLKYSYALILAEGEQVPSFELGEGLIGQVAASGKSLYLDELPEGYAARIESGLGNAVPKFLFVLPIQRENEITGVIEIATFTPLSEAERKRAQEAGNILADIS